MPNSPAVRCNEGTGTVAVVLDHAEGGTCSSAVPRSACLTAPTCPRPPFDQQQVRQGGELVLGTVRFLAPARRLIFRRTAGESLGQRGVVVGTRHGLHLEAAVARRGGVCRP